jgi:hypothetical protein
VWDEERHIAEYKCDTSIKQEKNVHEVFLNAMYRDNASVIYARPTDEHLTTCFIVTMMYYSEDVRHYFVESAGIRYARGIDDVMRECEEEVKRASTIKVAFIRPATQEELEYYEDTFCDQYV